ncbi:hypothetical protein P4B35_10965 [Pontiellaceae bacterium B12227]|nr:hypothetical protein [Pontiellaceae bacterium B12227]
MTKTQKVDRRSFLVLLAGTGAVANAQIMNRFAKSPVSDERQPLSYFNVYRGNTHSHTIFTWTHGAHRSKPMPKLNEPTEFKSHWKVPPGTDWKDWNTINLNPDDYTNLQGLPANHYRLAKENGYDFYATTDHSQEPSLQPVSKDNPCWEITQRTADEYTTKDFVAIPGFEYSRNVKTNGGRGHLTVLNTSEYVNADHGQRGPVPAWPGARWSIPQFYNWAKTAKPRQNKGCVVVGFNHPQVNQYDDWDNIDPEIVKRISTFELHTGYKWTRWEAYIRALNKGWKVAPIGVYDNHNIDAITDPDGFPPTQVLAHDLSLESITRALSERRTFVSWIKGVELRYAVNGSIMGSTIKRSDRYAFEIKINTRASHPDERVSKIQVLKNHSAGKDDCEVAAEITLDGNRDEVIWTPEVKDEGSSFYLLRVLHLCDGMKERKPKMVGSTISAPVWVEA